MCTEAQSPSLRHPGFWCSVLAHLKSDSLGTPVRTRGQPPHRHLALAPAFL